MNKLLLLFAFIVTTTATAFSLTPEAGTPFAGFYVGVGIGGLQNQSDSDLAINTLYGVFDNPVNQLNINASQNVFQNSLFGVIDLGYGYIIPRSIVYLGIEGFGDFARHEMRQDNASFFTIPLGFTDSQIVFLNNRTKISLRSFEYGADFKPGLLLGPHTLIYGRIGAAFNEIKLNSTNFFSLKQLFLLPTIANSQLNLDNSKNVAGLRLGAGIEAALNPYIGVHADYIHTDYGHIAMQGAGNLQAFTATGDPVTIPGGFFNATKFDLTSQMVLFGLNYYFDPSVSSDQMDALHSDYFDGIYAGIRAGGRAIYGDLDDQPIVVVSFFQSPDTAFISSQSRSTWKNGALGGLFVGYGIAPNNLPIFLGIEAFADISNGNSVEQHHQSHQFYQVNTTALSNIFLFTNTSASLDSAEFGADLRPGFFINKNTLLYGRLGVALNQLKVSSNDQLAFADIFFTGSVANSFLPISNKKEVWGLRLGAGLEEYLGNNISVNADYIYTNYSSISVTGIGSTLGFDTDADLVLTPNGFVNHVHANLAAQAITAGITYHFGNRL